MCRFACKIPNANTGKGALFPAGPLPTALPRRTSTVNELLQ